MSSISISGNANVSSLILGSTSSAIENDELDISETNKIRIASLETSDVSQNNRLTTLETSDVSQNNRLTSLETSKIDKPLTISFDNSRNSYTVLASKSANLISVNTIKNISPEQPVATVFTNELSGNFVNNMVINNLKLSYTSTAVGLWNFVNQVEDMSNVMVLKQIAMMGNREATTVTIKNMRPGYISIFDLNWGDSSETNYDFLTITKNSTTLVKVADITATGGFITGTINVSLLPDDVLTINYTKDGNTKMGFDTVYFYLKNLSYTLIPIVSLNVVRNSTTITKLLDYIPNYDVLSIKKNNIIYDIALLAGDIIEFSNNLVSIYKIDLVLDNVITGTSYLSETKVAKNDMHNVTFNNISHNVLQDNDILGWYEGESLYYIDFKDNKYFIKKYSYINICKDNITSLGYIDFPITLLGNSKYSWNNSLYIFANGIFTLDMTDITSFGVDDNRLVKIQNPDKRLWQYENDLKDVTKIYNNPVEFFDFANNYYISTGPSGFTERCKKLDLGITVSGGFYDVDHSTLARDFGGFTRAEYDDLYRDLRDVGILRKYKATRLVYYQDPSSVSTNDALTESQQTALTWQVNHNKYNYLAVFLDVPNADKTPGASNTDYARLMPGETVIMKGSGTRLDNFPLKLCTDGFHKAVNPGKAFIPDELYNNWTFYSIRLPFIIDGSNDTIWLDNSGTPLKHVIPHATYYLNELLDTINKNLKQIYIYIVYAGAAKNRMNVLYIDVEKITIGLYSPSHPSYASSFFGKNGMALDNMFTSNIMKGSSPGYNPYGYRVIRLTDANLYKYKCHTPLTRAEAQLLIDNSLNITLEAQHGPIRNNMPYDKYMACIHELSNAHSTETHKLIYTYNRRCEYGTSELYSNDFSKVIKEVLNNITLNPTVVYNGNQTSNDFPTALYPFEMFLLRSTGGHPSECSELYTSGYGSASDQMIAVRFFRLDWPFPLDPSIGQYPGQYKSTDRITLKNTSGQDISYSLANRSIEITIVNYLESAFWLCTREGVSGEATMYFDIFTSHKNVGGYNGDVNLTTTTNPNIVAGEYLVGIVKPAKVESALAMSDASASLFSDLSGQKIGYIKYHSTNVSVAGNITLLPWYTPGFSDDIQAGILAASTILDYFNKNNVKHIIVDIRNTIGGGTGFNFALQRLMGGNRLQNSYFTNISKTRVLNTNGIGNNTVIGEEKNSAAWDSGKLTKPNFSGNIALKHGEKIQPLDLSGLLPATCFFKGSVNNERRLLMCLNNVNISGTQAGFLTMKGSSINKETFDGDFGLNTKVILYGSYGTPFSTGGSVTSFINWYGVNRRGEEPIKNAPCPGLSRYEASSVYGYKLNNKLYSGGQNFGIFQKPHIKWNMTADIYFKDIGYIKGGLNVKPAIHGYPSTAGPGHAVPVDFQNPFTWRDSGFERMIQLACDPSYADHMYLDDGYGDIPVK